MSAPRIDRLENNYLINGGMDFWQRSNSAITIPDVGGGSFITVDRWSLKRGGSWNSNPTSQRSLAVPNQKTLYSGSMTGDPADSAAAIVYFQPIESLIARDLAGETVSLSAWVRTESALDIRLILDVPDLENDYTTATVAYDITQANALTVGAWTLVEFENISVPITATLGLRVGLLLTNMSVTGSSVEHNVTQIMLNKGNESIPFEKAGNNIDEEQDLCERFFQKTWALDVPVQAANTTGRRVIGCFQQSSSTIGETTIELRKTMRIAPTVTLYSSSGSTKDVLGYTTISGNSSSHPNFSIVRVTETGFNIETSSITGGNRGDAAELLFHYTLDAEIS